MDSNKASEIANELPGLIRVYKDGRVERLIGTDIVPAATHSITGVTSKDITIASKPHNISARIYLPKHTVSNQKFPLVVYFHGSAFCIQTPFSSPYHNYLNTLVGEAKVLAVSVNYRKAPEHPIPAAYEDSWEALKWVVAHSNNGGPEPWLNNHGDYDKLFLGGESAGGNIIHNLAMMAGDPEYGGLLGVEILGLVMIHPYFWGSESIGSEDLDPGMKGVVDGLWPFVCPSNPSNDDPRVNPLVEGGRSLAELGCRRVLVCVAEKDILKDRGRVYYAELGRVGWMGQAEIMETKGEGHTFYLFDLEREKTKDLIKVIADFLNRDLNRP